MLIKYFENQNITIGLYKGLVMWYLTTLNFVLGGTHEHKQLKWDDIRLREVWCLTPLTNFIAYCCIAYTSP